MMKQRHPFWNDTPYTVIYRRMQTYDDVYYACIMYIMYILYIMYIIYIINIYYVYY